MWRAANSAPSEAAAAGSPVLVSITRQPAGKSESIALMTSTITRWSGRHSTKTWLSAGNSCDCWLSHTNLTDACIDSLARIQGLEWVYVSKTQLTASRIDRLHAERFQYNQAECLRWSNACSSNSQDEAISLHGLPASICCRSRSEPNSKSIAIG